LRRVRFDRPFDKIRAGDNCRASFQPFGKPAYRQAGSGQAWTGSAHSFPEGVSG
jgi:hypothetical protein